MKAHPLDQVLLLLAAVLTQFVMGCAGRSQAIALESGRVQEAEHVILCGGPSLLKWENLRFPDERHDRFWGNFVRASTIRMDEIRREKGNAAKLVWIVYRPGYHTRAAPEGKPLISYVEDNARRRNCELIWVHSGEQAIRALNSRSKQSVVQFDYFGHSNEHCFLLDYSNEILGISKAWIHGNDLARIDPEIFSRDAVCQSFGCNTGKTMSKVWRLTLRTKLIGAIGKTTYEKVGQGQLPTVLGSWTR